MRNPMLETLEDRRLMAAQLTFGPNNLYFNAVKGSNQTYLLRVQNTGTTRVTLSGFKIVGDDAGSFKVTDFPSGGRSLGVGVQVNYTVQFSPGSGSDASIQTATLRALTTLPSKSGFYQAIPLRGMPTSGTSGSSEPSLQKIFDLYNLPIKSGESDANNYHFPTTQPTDTDEITDFTGSFTKAAAGNVTVTPLAVFTNTATPAIRQGFYTPGDKDSGKYIWYVPGDTSQSVNPFYYGTTKFDPGTAQFGLMTQYPEFYNSGAAEGGEKDGTARVVWSENTLNSQWSNSGSYHHFRIYPFKRVDPKDSTKTITVANAYIVAEEEYGDTSVADNQDNIFVVTNVTLTSDKPTLSLRNMTAYPDNETLVFNKVQTQNADVGNLMRLTNTERIYNTGTQPLVVSIALSGGDFSINSGGGSNITIAPGTSHDVQVKFNATSGTTLHTGTLTITSNDPKNLTKTVALHGEWEQYSEFQAVHTPSDEPTSAELINNVFGYGSKIPTAAQFYNNNNGASTTSFFGDEISAQTFVAADTSARVRVAELADFHGVTYTDTNGNVIATDSNMGWYTPGNIGSSKMILHDKQDTGQMILPTAASGQTAGSGDANFAWGQFNAPTGQFAFEVEHKLSDGNSNASGEFSIWTDNRDTGKFLRFFVARDKNGVVIPNTYFMLHDYDNMNTNFDFNDNIYLISNIMPAGDVKTTPLAYGTQNATTGSTLTWTSPVDGEHITGFNVYRSATANGVYSLLTGTPITARPTMTLNDDTATGNGDYFYAFESVGWNGDKSDRVIIEV